MSIKILVNPPDKLRLKDTIRADIAWQLFLPGAIGDVPPGWSKEAEFFKRWLWNELSKRAGFLRFKDTPSITIVTPRLTAAAREFIHPDMLVLV